MVDWLVRADVDEQRVDLDDLAGSMRLEDFGEAFGMALGADFGTWGDKRPPAPN